MPTQNKNGANPHNETSPVHTIGNHMSKQNTKKDVECKSLKEAMAKFQMLSVTATKDSSNPFFKSTYANLDEVIKAVTHGAEYGLSFSQSINYENVLMQNGEHSQKVFRNIFIETTVSHVNDTETLTSKVPVLIQPTEENKSQAMGSGITYSKRYALQAIYGLATDDDGNASSATETTETQTSNNNGWR